jgi:hypothetical protein
MEIKFDRKKLKKDKICKNKKMIPNKINSN